MHESSDEAAGLADDDEALEALDLTVWLTTGERGAASADVVNGDGTPSFQALPEMIDEPAINEHSEDKNNLDSQQQQHTLGYF